MYINKKIYIKNIILNFFIYYKTYTKISNKFYPDLKSNTAICPR